MVAESPNIPPASDTYVAQEGHEDPQGEMTGAISINMIISMLPVTIWCFFIAPIFLNLTWSLVTAVVLAILLPILFQPISRKLWVWLTHWTESLDL